MNFNMQISRDFRVFQVIVFFAGADWLVGLFVWFSCLWL